MGNETSIFKESKRLLFRSPLNVGIKDALNIINEANRLPRPVYIKKNRGGYYPISSLMVFLTLGIKKKDTLTLMVEEESDSEYLEVMKNAIFALSEKK